MISVLNDYPSALLKADKLYADNKSIFDINSVYKKHLKLYTLVLNKGR